MPLRAAGIEINHINFIRKRFCNPADIFRVVSDNLRADRPLFLDEVVKLFAVHFEFAGLKHFGITEPCAEFFAEQAVRRA